MEQKRLSKTLGIGLLSFAAIFFFNPIVAVIDFLPDVIGYLLLFAALRYLADLHPQLGEARSGFLRMALIDVLKLASLLWLVTMTSAKEQPNAQLLLTFSFSVIELIYGIPAWSRFFDGLFSLVSSAGELRRYDITPSTLGRIRKRERPAKSLLDRMKPATISFFVWRALLATLPEMTSLSTFNHSGYVTNFDRDIYDFRGLFVFASFAVMLLIGLRWLFLMLRLGRRLRTDNTALIETLRQRYCTEVLPRTELFLRRTLRLGGRLLVLAALFSADIYIDEINCLPDVLAAAFLIWALLVLRRRVDGWRLPLALGGLWGAVSLAASVFTRLFYSSYYPALIYKNAGAYDAYMRMLIFTVLEQLCFAAALISVTLMLCRIWRRFAVKGSYSDEMFGAEAARKLWIMAGLGCLSALTGVLYDWLLPSVEFIWLVDFGAALLFVFYAWKTLGEYVDMLDRAIEDGVPHRDEEREGERER